MKFLKNKRVKSIFLLVLLCSLLVGCDFNKNKDSNQSHRGQTNSSGVYIKKDNNLMFILDKFKNKLKVGKK